ncbi:MAG: site-specific integrase [Actinomycetota bacterium]
MTGSISPLPSGNLRLRVYVGQDRNTGANKYRSKTIPACSDRAARRELAAFVVECERFRQLDHGSDTETLHRLLEAWYELKESRLAPGTLEDYRRVIDRVTAAPLGKMKLREIRPSHLDAYYAELAKPGRWPDGTRRTDGLGPDRIRRYHSVLHNALRQAVKWEWIDRNPAENADPPELVRREATAPDPADLQRIIEAADPPTAVWLILAAGTAARPGELAALQWRDLDLAGEPSTITIRRALGPAPAGTEGPGGVHGVVEKTTKTGDIRTLALDPATVEVLRSHRRDAAANALAVGTSLPDTAYVFSYEPDGHRPWLPDAVGNRFRRIRTKLSLDHIKFYGTRHFHATQLLAAGVDVRTVANRMGHARTSTTTDVYAHVLKSVDQAAADTIGDIIHRRDA